MPFGLGFFATAGAGGVATTPTYELIGTVTVTSNQDYITFSGLPTNGTYSHYQLRGVTKNNSTSTFSEIGIRFNGSTSSYYSRAFYSNGSSVGDNGYYDNNNLIRFGNAANQYSGTYFSPFILDVMDANKTTKFKSVKSISGDRYAAIVNMCAGRWESTSAVTSITLLQTSVLAWLPGTRVSLYGVL